MKFINVKVRNTTSRFEDTYDADVMTPRMVFEDKGVPMSGSVTLDGRTLSANDLDKPLSTLTDSANILLASVVKADGAC